MISAALSLTGGALCPRPSVFFRPLLPSPPLPPRAAEHAIRYLEQCGHTVKKGRLFGRRDFYRSGSIRERAEEFNELLYDPEVTCLMGAVGGMVSNTLLPYLDYDFLKAHPKKSFRCHRNFAERISKNRTDRLLRPEPGHQLWPAAALFGVFFAVDGADLCRGMPVFCSNAAVLFR